LAIYKKIAFYLLNILIVVFNFYVYLIIWLIRVFTT
jgi:hypothetical protein